MYLPLHKLKIPAGNVRRSGFALVVSLLCFAAVAIAHMFLVRSVEYYAFLAGLLAFLLMIVFAVPLISAAVVFFLAPPVIYAFWDSPSLPLIRQWWFWLFVITAEGIGIRLLAIAEKKYPKRNR
jgi:hypothetical protein